jgi:retrograde regulation protein 2
LATICPAIPKDAKTWDEIVNLQCSTGHGLGKKGKKIGIRLKIILAESVKGAIHTSELESMFEKVGKGLSLPWKVESEVMWVESK